MAERLQAGYDRPRSHLDDAALKVERETPVGKLLIDFLQAASAKIRSLSGYHIPLGPSASIYAFTAQATRALAPCSTPR